MRIHPDRVRTFQPRKPHSREDRAWSYRACVLVVDDDTAIQKFVRASLPERQFDVLVAAAVEDAQAILSRKVPDLVVLDIQLERSEGWELLEIMREDAALRRIPVVMLTASERTADREKSLVLGADRYLQKPVDATRIRSVVRELLMTRDDLWWVLSLTAGETTRLRELLYDPTAQVQTLAAAIGDLRASVENGQKICAWWVSLEPLFEVEGYLWNTLDELRRRFAPALDIIATPLFGSNPTIAVSHPGANDFLCFVPWNEQQARSPTRYVESEIRKLVDDLATKLGMTEKTSVSVGYAVMSDERLYAPRLLHEVVRAAREDGHRREKRHARRLNRLFAEAIRAKSIATVFQPVVNLRTAEHFGMEALSRGPAGSEIEDPSLIFEIARDLQLVWDLESLCIENVLHHIEEVCSRGKLFFNLEAHFIQQLHYRGTGLVEPLLRCSEDVVIEVTERSSVRDFATFRETLSDLKRLGFAIAIDDCGSGYATLESVAELQPDYLKVGHSLLKGIETDRVRRRLVQLVAEIALAIGARPIAEAIETEEQRRMCLDFGIELGQGYLFSKPSRIEELRTGATAAS